DYLEHLKQLKAPDPPRGDVLDVAYRFKGTGSLGRLRFTLLVGQRGERRLVEMEEARQSAMDQALGKGREGERARAESARMPRWSSRSGTPSRSRPTRRSSWQRKSRSPARSRSPDVC